MNYSALTFQSQHFLVTEKQFSEYRPDWRFKENKRCSLPTKHNSKFRPDAAISITSHTCTAEANTSETLAKDLSKQRVGSNGFSQSAGFCRRRNELQQNRHITHKVVFLPFVPLQHYKLNCYKLHINAYHVRLHQNRNLPSLDIQDNSG